MTLEDWPDHLPVSQVRIARPTKQLEKITEFYHKGLGLPIIGSFEGHAGYSGVMIGLPSSSYHLEFTERDAGGPAIKPDPDHLLVLYMPDKQAIGRAVVKIGALGYFPVAPANPYWEDKGVTLEDPDGYHVVLCEHR